ncbi:MAG: squalene synthase HpnC [Pseudomonadota bacterium]
MSLGTFERQATEQRSGETAPAGAIEAPSGKGAKDENFPVGSLLIEKRLRPHVAAYYAFARAGDDIGDDPNLKSEEKVHRLTALETALTSPEQALPGTDKAVALNASLTELGVSLERGRKLLDAFRQDAVQSRYQTWADLIDYCTKSADPVGRFLLDIHGEDPEGYKNSDALCTVLQILNHLQDCGKDRAELDRVYIPTDWLSQEGLDVAILDGNHSPEAFRRVLDRCLDGCNPLLELCRKLPPRLQSRRLAAESAVIVFLAHRLHHRLRKGDPLARRVKLTKSDFARAFFVGIARLIFHVKIR